MKTLGLLGVLLASLTACGPDIAPEPIEHRPPPPIVTYTGMQRPLQHVWDAGEPDAG